MLLLEQLLDGLDVAVEPFALCEIKGDGLDMGRCEHASLHYVLAGEGIVSLPGGTDIPIHEHCVLIVPADQPHRIRIEGQGASLPVALARRVPLSEGWDRLVVGEGAAGLLIACGALHATYHQAQGLFDYLPEPIVETLREDDPVREAFRALLAELAAPQPGTRAVTQALMRQCLVWLLRRHCVSGECRLPWLSALEDPRLGRVLAALFDRPGAPHTVERLAEVAGMSRSAFAEHFVQAFARPPMEFLKEVRMRQAARLLRATDRPIKALAADVGYASRSSFSHAFKDCFGVSPEAYRQGDNPATLPSWSGAPKALENRA
jgi:AraC-like DNA-binding protein